MYSSSTSFLASVELGSLFGDLIINLPSSEYSKVSNFPLGIMYKRIKTIISITNKIVYAVGK